MKKGTLHNLLEPTISGYSIWHAVMIGWYQRRKLTRRGPQKNSIKGRNVLLHSSLKCRFDAPMRQARRNRAKPSPRRRIQCPEKRLLVKLLVNFSSFGAFAFGWTRTIAGLSAREAAATEGHRRDPGRRCIGSRSAGPAAVRLAMDGCRDAPGKCAGFCLLARFAAVDVPVWSGDTTAFQPQ